MLSRPPRARAAFSRRGAPLAQEFPSRNIDIIIPTGEGGGADRDARAFASVWGNHLPTNFQFGYYPGAAGQVGYEFYMSREPDAHSLIFANLGPEVIMLALQDTGISVGEDIVYIQQTLSEPMAVWVGPSSPFRTLEELVEEGRRRPLTVAVSRLPHPASIGMLALGEALGIEIVLVPYGGGNPTAMAAITLEVDCAALPVTNSIVLDDQSLVLGIFADENVAPDGTDNAPTVNAALGTSIPALTSFARMGHPPRGLRRLSRAGHPPEGEHGGDARRSGLCRGRGRRGRALRLHRSGRRGAGDGIGPGHHRNGPPLPRSADRFLIGGRGRAAPAALPTKKQASPEKCLTILRRAGGRSAPT